MEGVAFGCRRVLTVAGIDASCALYARVLSMGRVSVNGRVALCLGDQKINLHRAGNSRRKPSCRCPDPRGHAFYVGAASAGDAARACAMRRYS